MRTGGARQACGNFGLNLGIAFQMVDDALDYDGDPETMGKNVGDDLTEGKVTLPLIHTLRQRATADRSRPWCARPSPTRTAEQIDDDHRRRCARCGAWTTPAKRARVPRRLALESWPHTARQRLRAGAGTPHGVVDQTRPLKSPPNRQTEYPGRAFPIAPANLLFLYSSNSGAIFHADPPNDQLRAHCLTSLAYAGSLARLANSLGSSLDPAVCSRMDPGRAERKFTLEAAGLQLDYSKHLVDSGGALEALLELAEQADAARSGIEDLFNGRTRQQHRGPARPAQPVAGQRQRPQPWTVRYREVLRRPGIACRTSPGPQRGEHTGGYSGERRITDVVNIGIGGSDLGPRLVTRGPASLSTGEVRCHYVANVDPADLQQGYPAGAEPATTLFIVCSKSFRTEETLANGLAARDWMLAGRAHQRPRTSTNTSWRSPATWRPLRSSSASVRAELPAHVGLGRGTLLGVVGGGTQLRYRGGLGATSPVPGRGRVHGPALPTAANPRGTCRCS